MYNCICSLVEKRYPNQGVILRGKGGYPTSPPLPDLSFHQPRFQTKLVDMQQHLIYKPSGSP